MLKKTTKDHKINPNLILRLQSSRRSPSAKLQAQYTQSQCSRCGAFYPLKNRRSRTVCSDNFARLDWRGKRQALK